MNSSSRIDASPVRWPFAAAASSMAVAKPEGMFTVMVVQPFI